MRVALELKAWRLALAHLGAALLLPTYSLRRVRAVVFRLGGVRLVLGAEVAGGTRFMNANVEVGKGSFIGPGCQLISTAAAGITIGRGVALAPGVQVATPTHEIGPADRRAGRFVDRPVTIGDGAWIGARAVILPGVNVGPGAVVGANATVTKDVPANAVVAGTPATVIRYLTEPENS